MTMLLFVHRQVLYLCPDPQKTTRRVLEVHQYFSSLNHSNFLNDMFRLQLGPWKWQTELSWRWPVCQGVLYSPEAQHETSSLCMGLKLEFFKTHYFPPTKQDLRQDLTWWLFSLPRYSPPSCCIHGARPRRSRRGDWPPSRLSVTSDSGWRLLQKRSDSLWMGNSACVVQCLPCHRRQLPHVADSMRSHIKAFLL